ncbi:MAG: LCP family protein [Candidatus Yanofskybacteria bacterium]|nr:LCP family protein [Candidatus Yanofskybacteria bacterium]
MNQTSFQQSDFNEKSSSKKRFGLSLALIILLLLGLLLLFDKSSTIIIEKQSSWLKRASALLTSKKGEEVNQQEELNKNFPMPEEEAGRLNVLILGIRGVDDPDGGLLTDSIMLFSFRDESKKASLTSIPRDLYIDLPGLFKGKANEIYERGLSKKDKTNFAKNSFSRISGIFIDKIVVFDFQGFKEIVDALDGIDIVLEKPFEEKSQWGYEFSLSAGENHLDGQTALYYARSRYSTNDFDRSRRQQEIILAVKKKALSLGILSNPVKITSLANSLKNNISTDFNIWDTKNILQLALTFNSAEKLQTKTITTENLLYETAQNNAYVLLPKNNDWNLIRNYFKQN